MIFGAKVAASMRPADKSKTFNTGDMSISSRPIGRVSAYDVTKIQIRDHSQIVELSRHSIGFSWVSSFEVQAHKFLY